MWLNAGDITSWIFKNTPKYNTRNIPNTFKKVTLNVSSSDQKETSYTFVEFALFVYFL